MAKIVGTFRMTSYETDSMYKNAKKFNIKATPVCYFGESPNEMVDVKLECQDVQELHEFCFNYCPNEIANFWHFVEEE